MKNDAAAPAELMAIETRSEKIVSVKDLTRAESCVRIDCRPTAAELIVNAFIASCVISEAGVLLRKTAAISVAYNTRCSLVAERKCIRNGSRLMADMYGKEVNFITRASIKKARSICRALTEPGGTD